MRLFYAIELPDDVRAALAKLKPKDDDQNRDYRWADPAQMHVTLAFLGQQPAEQLPLLEAIGTSAAAKSHPARLQLGEVGSFGPRRAPRVLWIGLDGEVGALQHLQADLDAGLRQAGFSLEERPFRPHITLARRRDTARSGAPPGWPPDTQLGSRAFETRHLTLFESRLSPRGATYVPVAQFALAAA
jgi:2'-5' RNA ligase